MKLFKAIGVAAAFGLLGATAQAAVTISKDLNDPVSIPGLTGFQTSGDDMAGMVVTARFTGIGDGPIEETLIWAVTGADSGGVTSSLGGWGLSVSGDTFNAAWNFTINGTAGLGQLTSFTLNGGALNAFTVFDTTDPDTGTEGSASGRNFVFSSGCTGCDVNVIYSTPVAISPNSAVGDIFHVMTVNFLTDTGPATSFSFQQDTDNDARRNNPVPEPGTLALAGLALAGLGAARRRAR